MTKVLITTNMGNITAELDADKAPKTVANFLEYANKGHEPGMKQKPAEQTVENEGKNGLKNDIYTLAMARTSDPHSASAQFFINVKNNSFLDYPGQDGWGYAVFGKVTGGTDVVDQIRKVKTTRSGMFADVPVEPVIIEKVEVL